MKPVSLVCIFLSLALASPARSQTLADRINQVRNQPAKQNEKKIDKTSVPYMLGVLLYSDITVSYEDSPARDVFKHLAEELQINIIGRYSDDRSSPGRGIDPDTPITLSVEETPALAVLELVLEQCGNLEPVTWQFRRGFLEVGTIDRLSRRSARVVRVYPIDDLLFEAPRFTDAPSLDLVDAYRHGYLPYGLPYGSGVGGGAGGTITPGRPGGGSLYPYSQSPQEAKQAKAQEIIEAIITQIEPAAWINNGGEYATIKYFDGALIVRAPDYIHRQIGGYPKPLKPKPAAEEVVEKPEDEKP
ncbi:MAG: hypothetical protein IIB54_03595 [Planctomycetes bacterium]|nr:hypothetical protein [Planctomycetota bacterium]